MGKKNNDSVEVKAFEKVLSRARARDNESPYEKGKENKKRALRTSWFFWIAFIGGQIQ